MEGILVMVAMLVGIAIGSRMKTDKEIIPIKETIEVVKEVVEKVRPKTVEEKVQDKYMKDLNTVLQNVSNYDGTGKNQKRVGE